ncbi:MAG TPA: S4 domain-containing protein, partial [Verrucomicrobiae bacterium]|nr:S4 domain-containing protein [Verrucomicrobiae bacterium]
DQVFKNKELPDEIENVDFPRESSDLVSLLKDAGLVASKSEARRLIEQGGVKLEREKVTDANAQVNLKKPVLVQCGKRKFVRIQYRG